MQMLDVLIPVLDRPWRVQPLVDALTATLQDEPVLAQPLFLCTPGDEKEIALLERCHIRHHVVERCADGQHEYGRKINDGALLTDSDWLLLAADDIEPQPGWWTEAMKVQAETGALVVGTQDEGNQLVKRGEHSTHTLVHRSYIGEGEGRGTIDDTGVLLCELYQHNSVDVEFVETAMFRNVWAFADLAVLHHDHPLWSRGKVRRDATYQKGLRHAMQDRALLNSRRPLWNGKPDRNAVVRAQRRRRMVVPARAPISNRWPPRQGG